MNIKKYSLKTMCAALACTTFLSSMLAAYATDVIINETPMDDSAETLANDSAGTDTSDSGWTTEENSFEDIKVTYQQSSSYTVTIPKTIALDTKKQAAYSVKVSGNIDGNQRVYVAPVDGITDSEKIDFHMKDLSGKKADVVATVTQNKVQWNSEEVANSYEETNNCVSAPDLTAGTWEGTFQVEIRLETEKAHEHNYVDGVCTGCGEKDPDASHDHNYIDGKCDCGAVDPNHTHNYVDGTCTICGKETDPYEAAPANEYSNWLYELDEENGTIGLKKYKGISKNVIVYDNYQIGDKTYKTKILDATKVSYPSSNYMFASNKSVETIAFGDNIDFSEVANMEYMFYYCETLTSIDFGNGFDTSNATDMKGMFHGCKSLIGLDLSSFNTSNVTDMSYMFCSCSSLLNLDIANFDTSNVTAMNQMFYQCSSLSSLDLSSFNTDNVTDMSHMFYGCSSLTSLDVSSFNTSQVTTMPMMFYNCSKLETIYASSSKWSTSQANNTTSMFYNCGTDSVTYID